MGAEADLSVFPLNASDIGVGGLTVLDVTNEDCVGWKLNRGSIGGSLKGIGHILALDASQERWMKVPDLMATTSVERRGEWIWVKSETIEGKAPSTPKSSREGKASGAIHENSTSS